MRIHEGRTIQRQVLHLGELNTTQLDHWQRTLEIINEDDGGRRIQGRLFAAQDNSSAQGDDVISLRMSSFARAPAAALWRLLGGLSLVERTGLGKLLARPSGLRSRSRALGQGAGTAGCQPPVGSTQRALCPRKMVCANSYGRAAGLPFCGGRKRPLYRCLDHIVKHKAALEQHLAGRWKDLFGASFDLVLYDLTSTYFEGAAQGVSKAKRGYSRDHRPDCKQVVVALVVTAEGFPLTYEVFAGNRIDSTTLEHIVQEVETKHGRARRVWVFDRGISTEANLAWLRQHGACYLVGTPKNKLSAFEAKLTDQDWHKAAAEVEVKLCAQDHDTYVLCRSAGRVQKEHAMRRRALKALVGDLLKLKRSVARGHLKDEAKIQRKIAHLEERHRLMWRFLKHCSYQCETVQVCWEWHRPKWKAAVARDGAYLLRAHWPGGEHDPAQLWQTYVQLTEAEAAFRTMKSEIKVRLLWHQLGRRIEAHIMVAFLGYAMHVYLKKLAARKAPSLTPWQVLQHLRKIVMVDVEFDTTDGRSITLPRITIPEKEQAALLLQLGWTLPQQPPPRIKSQPAPEAA